MNVHRAVPSDPCEMSRTSRDIYVSPDTSLLLSPIPRLGNGSKKMEEDNGRDQKGAPQ